MDPRTTALAWLSAAALLLTLIGGSPVAAAHTCTAEKGETNEESCSAECPDGETHSHTVTHHHENGLAEDESHVHYHCESTTTNDPDCEVPAVLGICPVSTAEGALAQVLGGGGIGCLSSRTSTAPQIKAILPPADC